MMGRLIFLPNGEFSMTRIVMVLAVTQGMIVLFSGLICSLFTYVSIKPEVYSYSFKLLSLGVVQYTGSKIKDSFDNKIPKV